MKKPIVGCGWKMYLRDSEATAHAMSIKERVPKGTGLELYVLPSFTAVRDVKRILEDTDVSVGVQNIAQSEAGAYTGEVSIRSVDEIGVKYVEIGHAERKAMYGETDATINEKLKLIVKYNMTAVFCFGENAEQKEANLTVETLLSQLEGALVDVTPEQAKTVIYAYEPVWAIGKTVAASPEYVQETLKKVRDTLKKIYPDCEKDDFKIIYGGSVTMDNCRELGSMPDVDGLFVGRGALNIDNYLNIIANFSAGFAEKTRK